MRKPNLILPARAPRSGDSHAWRALQRGRFSQRGEPSGRAIG
jgi:hypothetical protein